MTHSHPLARFLGICALATIPLASPAQDLSLNAPMADEAYDYGEELLRGPVHEAFAEQYASAYTEPFVVDRAPPAAIPEVPPQLKPAGKRIEWIPGYWFWDEDRDDYIWISGIWRNIPPGLRWVPGYWDGSSGRHRWIAGTWVAIEQDRIDYLAQAPPESLDYGPVGAPPSADHFWIPGCWNWRGNAYAWRPGYWSTGHSNWVWIPERYLWTPSGYVFCRGYWDYPVTNRGVLFAPFWFQRPVYVTTGFRYVPRVSLLGSALQAHFWVRPSCHHYYFGDFYASRYRSRGIHPWHSYSSGGLRHSGAHGHNAWGLTRVGYDPLFSHHHRDLRGRSSHDLRQASERYQALVDHADRRPPATYRDLRKHDSRSDVERLADTLQDLARRNPSRYSRLSDSQWQEYRGRAAATPELASLRRDRESHGYDRHRVARQADDAAKLPRPSEPAAGSRTGDFRGGSFRLPPDRTVSDRGRPRDIREHDRPIVDQPGKLTPERPTASFPGRPFPVPQRPEVGRPEVGRPEVGRPEVTAPGVAPIPNRSTGSRPSANRPSASNLLRFDRPARQPSTGDRPAMGASSPTSRPENAGPRQRGTERPAAVLPTRQSPRSGRPEFESAITRGSDAVGPGGVTRPSVTKPRSDSPLGSRSQRPSPQSLPSPQASDPGPRVPGADQPPASARSWSRPSGSRPGRDLSPTRSAPRVAPIAQASAVQTPKAPQRSAPTGSRAGGRSRDTAVAKPEGDAGRRAPRAIPSTPRRNVESAGNKPAVFQPRSNRGPAAALGNRAESSEGRRGRGSNRDAKP